MNKTILAKQKYNIAPTLKWYIVKSLSSSCCNITKRCMLCFHKKVRTLSECRDFNKYPFNTFRIIA